MMRFIVTSLVALSFVALVTVTLSAQQGFGRGGRRGGGMNQGQPKYDPSQEEILSGEVAAVKDIEMRSGKTTGAGLELQTGGQNLDVYLGPHIYVDLQNVKIEPGDSVEIKGVKTLVDGQVIFLAGEVRKGSDVLKLRDDKGTPLWAGNRQRGGW